MKLVIEVPDNTIAVNITSISYGINNKFNLNTTGYDIRDLQKVSDSDSLTDIKKQEIEYIK